MTEEILRLLRATRFRWRCEKDLQDGVAEVLADLAPSREHRLSDSDVVDFLVGTAAIEVKIAGSPIEVGRQLARYAAHAEVESLILVTGRSQLKAVPRKSHGKPIHVVALLGSLL